MLSDGLLWDVRSATIIHKFDKLNPHISGLFHPRGLEAIINTEVVSDGFGSIWRSIDFIFSGTFESSICYTTRQHWTSARSFSIAQGT